MDLIKISKNDLKYIAATNDVWSIYIRMKEMLGKIKGVDFNEEWDTESRFNQIPTGFSLDVEYIDATDNLSKLSLKQTGNAPESISTHVNLVVQLARLTNRTIEEVNKENYLTNKKLIKKFDRVVYLAREYLKVYKQAYSGIPPAWLDDNIAALKWTPNANLRVLTMLKAAKKMEKALEGVKEHLRIDPFKEVTVDDKTMINLTFSRLSDDIDQVTLDADIKIFANLILNPISIYLKEECPDLPEEDKSKLDGVIWETVVKDISFSQLPGEDKAGGIVGYLMAIGAAIPEIIKHTKRDLIVDLLALEAANSMLIDQYLDDIYGRRKFIINSVSGAVTTKVRPALYEMPKTPELNILEVGDKDRYIDFMKVKGTRMVHILRDVVSQERKLDSSRFGFSFMDEAVTLSLIDTNEKAEEKYRLEYTDWMNEYHDVYKQVFDCKADAYHPLIQVLFNSHAVVDAIGKKRIFNTNGFKMLLDEAQEVLVYSKAHFEKAVDNNDDRYSDVINDAWDKIAKIDYLKFDRTVNASKNGIINDLECRLTVKKDDLDLSFHIHVNSKAYLLTYEHVKHELKVGDEIAVDIIYLSLLKDFALEYCRDKPLEKALSKISDGLDIRLMDKLSSVLTVQFIDGGLPDVSDFINDIGGLRYTYSLNYTVEGR